MGKFSRKTLRSFHCFSDFWIKLVNIMLPNVVLGLTLNILRFYSSLTVLNPEFTGVMQKSPTSAVLHVGGGHECGLTSRWGP